MKQAAPDRSMLIKYLLGELKDPEFELIERYFEDDELFDELLEVEDELLDKHVRGELTASEQKQFASYLDKLPGGRERLKFAVALIKVADREHEQSKTVSSEARSTPAKSAKAHTVSLWKSLLAMAHRPKSVSQYLLVASLVIVAVGILWLIIYSRQLSTLNAKLRLQLVEQEAEQAILQQKTRELQQQVEANTSRLEQFETEMERERERGDGQAQEIAKLRGLPTPLDEWALMPLESRKALDTPASLVLRRGAKLISITIPIESGSQTGSYRGVLQTTEGVQVLQQDRLRIISRKTGKVAVLRVDAGKLTATSYKLTIIDPERLSHDYYFNVTKR